MQKIFEGKITSLKMQNTAVVEVTRRKPHPLYKVLLKRSNKFKADTAGLELKVGDRVKIGEIRPMSKDKYFKITEVIK
ncbi:MAG: 30S ribosomal protein S17 [Patescibacteria group bacterium]